MPSGPSSQTKDADYRGAGLVLEFADFASQPSTGTVEVRAWSDIARVLVRFRAEMQLTNGAPGFVILHRPDREFIQFTTTAFGLYVQWRDAEQMFETTEDPLTIERVAVFFRLFADDAERLRGLGGWRPLNPADMTPLRESVDPEEDEHRQAFTVRWGLREDEGHTEQAPWLDQVLEKLAKLSRRTALCPGWFLTLRHKRWGDLRLRPVEGSCEVRLLNFAGAVAGVRTVSSEEAAAALREFHRDPEDFSRGFSAGPSAGSSPR